MPRANEIFFRTEPQCSRPGEQSQREKGGGMGEGREGRKGGGKEGGREGRGEGRGGNKQKEEYCYSNSAAI